MQPPYELVFRDMTPQQLIAKLREIGCVVEFAESSPRQSSDVLTQHISLSFRGISPMGAWFAWRHGSSTTSLVYLPHPGPLTVRQILRFLTWPFLGIVRLFSRRFDEAYGTPDSELREAERKIVELLASDQRFVHDGFYSFRDGPNTDG